MRKLLLAVPAAALLALPAAAWAGPQRLDEGRLGGVAAGQDAGVAPGFSTVIDTPSTTTNTSSVSSSQTSSTNQSLIGQSSNSTYATGIFSSGVTAGGGVTTGVMGTIGAP